VGFILIPAYCGEIPFLLAITGLSLRAQHELYQASGPCRRLEWWLLGSLNLALLLLAHRWDETHLLRGALAAGILLLVRGVFVECSPYGVYNLGRLLLVSLYPACFLTYLILIHRLPQGFLLVIFPFAILETNDSFALVIGKLWGRQKIFPSLTPKKTYSGFFGGLLFGGLAGIGYGLIATSFGLPFIFFGTALVLLLATLGDLVASKIKRNLDIKDFGESLTAHGGMLDVYDSLIFVGPVFYWYVVAFQ
jgi:CDP-diglyceride synthetase